MATRAELLDLHESLTQAVLAAEDWHESYKKDEDSFQLLVALESALERSIAEYLSEQAVRLPSYIDWSVLKASSGVPPATDPVWEAEMQLLTAAVLQILTDVTELGTLAGAATYDYPIDFDSLDEAIMQSARKQTAQLVKGVTATTRKLLREAVAQSIALGEDSTLGAARIRKLIDNPVRAQLIAQTEPVNAYQNGLSRYAKSTGAIEKTWDGLKGACNICSPLIGKTIGIDETFILANGQEVEHPAGHPRCRCSLIYLY